MKRNAKSFHHPAAFAMAVDIKGFSSLKTSIHEKIVERLYPKLAQIVHVGNTRILLDKKSIGDGFMFYFANVSDALDAALTIRLLFREHLFWRENAFEHPLKCRIGLHAGKFLWKKDAIEQREALFGRNVITVARLEPVVTENEIWCTQSFKAEAETDGDFHPRIKFTDIGERQFAKGWAREKVYSVSYDDEAVSIPSLAEAEIVHYNNKNPEFPYSYFALIRLRDRTHGVNHLRSHLSGRCKIQIEAEYDIFGAYDVILRFKAEKKQREKEFAKMLREEQYIRHKNDCRLTEITFEDKGLSERIVTVPKTLQHIKAFTYIKSHSIVQDKSLVRKVVELAQKACGKEFGVVTYYRNSDVLILPIVIPLEHYYALAGAIDQIESWVDKNELDYNSIITYPVHAFQEYFNNTKP